MKKIKTIYRAVGALRKPFIFMKLTLIMMLSCSLHSFAGANAQTITLNAQNKKISQVLSEIEKQGDFRFLYNSRLKDLDKKVTVEFKETNINLALQKLFTGTSLAYKKLENNLIALRSTNDADVTVNGKVIDADGKGVSGASVVVRGGSGGTNTDASGNFTITVPDNAVLLISAVGFNTETVNVSGRTDITVLLNRTNSKLEEVVVVGYGTQKKRDLTGSISSVSGDELAKQPNTNPISSLQGRVPGLTISNSGAPGSSPVVRIRGVNSTNSASPVYVVDGILQDNIDYLNPADIESIDVLRDPSSIAIYGLRGANGVIAVTTKKAARGKTRISLQSSYGIQTVQNKIELTDAEGFKKLVNQQIANAGGTAFDFSKYTANTDWQDQIFKDAPMTSHNVSVSNSNDKSTTILNVGYTNQEGVLRNSNYQRYLIRLNQEIKVNSKLKFGGEITGYHYDVDPSDVNITNALWMAPVVPIQYDPQTYYSSISLQRIQVGNPVANIYRNDGTTIQKGYRVVGNIYGEWKFLNNFTWRSTLYGDLGFFNSRGYNALPFKFYDLGEGTQKDSIRTDNNARTSVSQSQNENRRFQQDHTLTFDKKIGSDHSLNAVIGFTTLYTANSSVNGSRTDTFVNIPNDPNLWYLGIANDQNPTFNSGGGSESSIVGSFLRGSYAFKNKYLLNATIRRDGSSKFAPENRWGTFGSVGAGWVISDEKFMADNNSINFLKLRAAWGLTGNANGFSDFLYKPGISNSNTAIFGDNIYQAIQASYLVDPNLHWEIVRGFDVGLDLKALQNRFNSELTLYNRTTTDILTSVAIPNDSRTLFTNLGKITNKGIEFAAGWNDKIGNDFSWGISGNVSYNDNTVNAIGDKFNFQITGNGGINLTTTGRSIGYFYGYRQAGIYQSTADLAKMPAFPNSLPGDIAYEDLNGDGVINTDDRTYLGSPFPTYNYGASFNIAYKNVDFMIDGQGAAGHKIYTQRRTASFATLNFEANRLSAWTGPGTTNVEPIIDNRGNNLLMSTYFLEKGDFFRIRNIQLGYRFSNALLSKAGMSQARLYVSAQNVKTWSRVSGYSPEPLIGSILGGGADNGAYPVPAIYTVGLNVTF